MTAKKTVVYDTNTIDLATGCYAVVKDTETKIEQDPILFANTALTLCDNNRERAEHAVKITMGLDPDLKKAELFQLMISDVSKL